MFQKALAAKQNVGPSLYSSPRKEIVRQPCIRPLQARSSAVSAGLSAEEDFELGAEFLDVFTRAGDRIAGFVAGCTVLAAVWFFVSIL
jgi:hypothetical protein